MIAQRAHRPGIAVEWPRPQRLAAVADRSRCAPDLRVEPDAPMRRHPDRVGSGDATAHDHDLGGVHARDAGNENTGAALHLL